MEFKSRQTVVWAAGAILGYFLAGGTFHPIAILFSIFGAYIAAAVAYSVARSFVDHGDSDNNAMWSLAYLAGPFVTFGVCWIIMSFVGSGRAERWDTEGNFQQYVAPITYEAFYYAHLKMFAVLLVPSMFGIRLAEHKSKTKPPSFLDEYKLENEIPGQKRQCEKSD